MADEQIVGWADALRHMLAGEEIECVNGPTSGDRYKMTGNDLMVWSAGMWIKSVGKPDRFAGYDWRLLPAEPTPDTRNLPTEPGWYDHRGSTSGTWFRAHVVDDPKQGPGIEPAGIFIPVGDIVSDLWSDRLPNPGEAFGGPCPECDAHRRCWLDLAETLRATADVIERREGDGKAGG